MKEFILKHKIKLSILAFVAIFLSTSMVLSKSQSYYAVYADGKEVGVVQHPRIAQQALQSLIKSKEEDFKQKVIINTTLDFKKVSNTNNTLNVNEMAEKLSSKVNYSIKAIAINIDNDKKIILKDRSSANQLIKKVKNHYQSKDNASVKVVEDVELKEITIAPNEILPVDKAFNLAVKGINFKKYTVKEGDTLWDLAIENNISVDYITQANPEIYENLQIGTEINIPGQPLLNVLTTYTEEVIEGIPYKVIVKKNSSLASGKSKIIKRGQSGKKKVKYKIVHKNGIEISRIAKTEKIEATAVNQVVEKGTRTALVASRGGNSIFLKPTDGYVSSKYGQRWGTTHEGIDIANTYGAPVVAADSGKVIRVGWINGYGNTIDIQHDNGLVTRYAHLSKYLVSTNTNVKRGQEIGKVGTSGRTTGPNLHFEVIKSGTSLNPLNYL
ncbi:MAG: M23 family metallopeptidase [Firmicutes bacterium]|nr:M23 family metallopeptidase [Bacillota bacterium]